MISFNVQANREDEFSFRLGKLTELVRKGLVDPEIGTLSVQARLLTERCMQATPPRSVGQGKRRVKYDLQKIFHPVDPGDFESKSVQSIIRRSDASAWDAFARNLKKGPLAGTVAVTPNDTMHQANRDTRGRAKRTNFATLWKQRGELKALIRKAQERVGWARAGWMTAYRALGGTRAPEWVSRHGNAPGSFVRGTDVGREFIDVRNGTGWGKYRANSDKVVRWALASRASAMKTYFEKMMGLAASATGTPYQAQQAQIAAQFTDAA